MLYVIGGVIASMTIALLAVVFWPDNRGSDALEAVATAAADRDVAQSAPDPWENRGDHAIRATQRHRSAATGDRVTASIDASSYIDLPLFDGRDASDFEWRARRVTEASLYWVEYGVEQYGVFMGAKWLVQMDPEGERPEGSDGVIASNALAEFIETPDRRRSVERAIGRSEQILRELTAYPVSEGVQLSSAIIVYFLGREFRSEATEAIGWLVVPRRITDGDRAIYDTYFQWLEGEHARSAQWQIDLESGAVLARNLVAAEIMENAAEIDPEEVVDINPRSLDLSVQPRRERNSVVRALRYVLHDTRRVKAVGTLLAAQQANAEIEYDGWRIEPDGCSDCRVIYRYSHDGDDRSISWDVSSSGEVVPVDEIAGLAERSLSLVDALHETRAVAEDVAEDGDDEADGGQ